MACAPLLRGCRWSVAVPSCSPAAFAITVTAFVRPFASMFMRSSFAFFGSGSNATARPKRPVRIA